MLQGQQRYGHMLLVALVYQAMGNRVPCDAFRLRGTMGWSVKLPPPST